jgi:putative colanic acid biosynthesis UDP-glucose lipid carrier transferase
VSRSYWTVIVLGALLFTNLMSLQGGYEFESLRRLSAQFRAVLIGLIGTLAIVLMVVFFEKLSDALSRIWMALWFVSALPVLMGERWVLSKAINLRREAGELALNVAIVAPGAIAWRGANHLRESWRGEVNVVAMFRIDPRREAWVPLSATSASSGAMCDDLVRLCRTTRIDEVIVVLPRRVSSETHSMLRQLSTLPVNVDICPAALTEIALRPRALKTIEGIPVLNLYARPMQGTRFLVKRSMDLGLSMAALIVLAPVMGLISIVVKLDSPGPVLFSQRRFGFNNNIIYVHKFRTMRMCDDDGVVPQATRNDPRVTRVGRFLRKTSLDELPQLFNVLKGEMSLVGPRPHAVAHNEKYAQLIDRYMARHRVKPGITGWAQVNGLRGETNRESMEARVQYDQVYIENWSVLFDLKILLRTLFVGFVHPRAY